MDVEADMDADVFLNQNRKMGDAGAIWFTQFVSVIKHFDLLCNQMAKFDHK